MALELQYRPKKLSQIIGNSDIIPQLEMNYDGKTASKHTVLLHGPRGCGKTTIARILAKRVKCKEIIEFDIASTRGIDTAKEISLTARGMSVFGGNKAYILDEVHKGTKDFFNALLKILEEPPHHVFFFLCTTNPEKVIKTVLSRCARYQVDTLTKKECKKLLNRIIKKEKAKIDDEILDLIAHKSDGIPREAIIMLDQIIKLPSKDRLVTINNFNASNFNIIDLCRALMYKKKWSVLKIILNGLKNEDPERIRHAVLGYMHSVVLKSEDIQAFNIIDCFQEPFYNSGKAGLALACYECTQIED